MSVSLEDLLRQPAPNATLTDEELQQITYGDIKQDANLFNLVRWLRLHDAGMKMARRPRRDMSHLPFGRQFPPMVNDDPEVVDRMEARRRQQLAELDEWERKHKETERQSRIDRLGDALGLPPDPES